MTQTQPQFKVGDRCFTHYDMKWGTVAAIDKTYRDQKHGVTGNPLPDTTWYHVKYDDGGASLLDDAHGDWDMARILPPNIAADFGYGVDPNPCHYPNLWYNASTGKCEHADHDSA